LTLPDVVKCPICGELMLRETWEEVGEQNHSSGACPYCLYTPEQRQLALRVREVTIRRVKAGLL